jgi:signal transduction histidine kinase/formate hydrogenlyase subunit 6/NADH:ubiquinone oxidoreductase subunit I
MENKATVLVIDDEEPMRDSCRQVLTNEGYHVEVAEDGLTGLEKTKKLKPDMALIDMKMPGLSGMELLEKFNKLDPSIINIVITGYATVESALQAMKLGAYDFLSKPFSPDELRVIVKRGLEKRKLLAEATASRQSKESKQENIIKILSEQLNQPLSAIRQNLKDLSKTPSEMTGINEHINDIVGMTEKWMDYFSLDKTKIENNFKAVKLASLLNETTDSVKDLALKHKVALHYDYADAGQIIMGDAGFLKKAVSNLLINAVQFNKENGNVTISVKERGSNAEIIVSDTGIGIPKNELPLVFNEFYHGKTDGNGKKYGLGLGLAFTKRIIEIHNGSIKADSTHGKGSSFTITLPKDITVKPKVAIFDFASCEGCQLQVVNLEQDIINVVTNVDIVSFREAIQEHSDDYEIAFIEGASVRPSDEERLKKIRARAKILIALGACATTGGIPKMKNKWADKEAKKAVYGDADLSDKEIFNTDKLKAIDEVVKVDFYIRGCPVRKEQVLYYINRLLSVPPHTNMDVRVDLSTKSRGVDTRSVVTYNANKCILCRRCDAVCRQALGIDALAITGKGSEVIVSTPGNIGFDSNGCIQCGQCVASCPVGALDVTSNVGNIAKELKEGRKKFVIAIDSVALASFAESHPILKIFTPKEAENLIINSLRQAGFDKIVQYEHYLSESLKNDAKDTKPGKPKMLSWCKGAFNYASNKPVGKSLEISEQKAPWNLLSGDFSGNGICLLSPCTALRTVKNISYVLSAIELDALFKELGIKIEFADHLKATYDGPTVKRKEVHLGINPTLSLEQKPVKSVMISPDINQETSLINDLYFELYPCFKKCLTGGGNYPAVDESTVNNRKNWLDLLWR